MKQRGARLGQHFLTNKHYAKVLAEAVAVRAGETILEIGPGKGALTKELLNTGAKVVAIEKDEVLAEGLKTTFAQEIGDGKFEILTGDVRDFFAARRAARRGLAADAPYIVAANIPYYITGEIIRQFLTAEHQPRAMALLVQKEVAERIIARDKKESILSLSVKAYGAPKIVAKVGRGNFSPPPSVDSAILLIENISRDFFSDITEDDFFKIVHAGFAAKRKMLAGNLATLFEKEKITHAFASCGIDPKIRAEDVSLDAWKRIIASLT